MNPMVRFWTFSKEKDNKAFTRTAKDFINKAEKLGWMDSLATSSSLCASASTWDPLPCSSSVQQLSAWLAWWITVCCRFISLVRTYRQIQHSIACVINQAVWKNTHSAARVMCIFSICALFFIHARTSHAQSSHEKFTLILESGMNQSQKDSFQTFIFCLTLKRLDPLGSSALWETSSFLTITCFTLGLSVSFTLVDLYASMLKHIQTNKNTCKIHLQQQQGQPYYIFGVFPWVTSPKSTPKAAIVSYRKLCSWTAWNTSSVLQPLLLQLLHHYIIQHHLQLRDRPPPRGHSPPPPPCCPSLLYEDVESTSKEANFCRWLQEPTQKSSSTPTIWGCQVPVG